MTVYERLLEDARRKGLVVKEYPFTHHDGLIVHRKIGIRKTITTSAEKADILAEEIAHWETTVGNILDQSKVENRKQERKARAIAYNRRVGLQGIIDAWEYGCQNTYEASEYLGTHQSTFEDALKYYHEKYGVCTVYKGYTIIFEPTLMVLKEGEKWEDLF